MTLIITDLKITVKPNNSLSLKSTVWLLLGLTAISMLVGVGFAIAGAWLVLPFAGLEMLAIAYAFYWMHLHSNDFESISIQGDRVVVEKYQNNALLKHEFHRYWVKVVLRKHAKGGGGLFLGSHGKEIEFGRNFINDEQRIMLARQIKQKLNKGN